MIIALQYPRARNFPTYTAICGAAVRAGRRQSIPSSSIESCAGVSETTPPVACGQMKRPRSSRLAKRHRPSPSHQSTLSRSPRRPRKIKTCPEKGTGVYYRSAHIVSNGAAVVGPTLTPAGSVNR